MTDKITTRFVSRVDGRISIGSEAVKAVVRKIKKEKTSRRLCAGEVLKKYALLIQGDARRNLNKSPTRIDTGDLRTSIQTFIRVLFTLRLKAAVYTNKEYAPYVHWGTGIHGENPEGGHRETPWVYYDAKRKRYVFTEGMMPNPFLLDAFETHEKAFLRDLEKCLKEP